MDQEQRADALAVRIKRKELHPARIDANERLAWSRRQTGNRPVMPLGPARDRDAVAAIAVENLQDFLCLRLAQQLLEASEIIEAQFQRFEALVDVVQRRLAVQPVALLLEIEEAAQTGSAWATRAHVSFP